MGYIYRILTAKPRETKTAQGVVRRIKINMFQRTRQSGYGIN
jgi:hypothetical protein